MASRFTLHPFVPAHLPELTDLWVESWAGVMPAIDFEARRGWLVDHLAALAAKGTRILCAFETATGTMAGFVTIDPATGWLDQIAVAPRYQGAGAAERLLDAARAVSPAGIRLDVNEANARARAFYAREGFIENGRGMNPASGLATILLRWAPTTLRA